MSVLVAYLNVVSVAFNEPKTEAPLVVDGNRVLPFPVAPEGVKPVAGRHLQVVQPNRQGQVLKLSRRPPGDIRRKLLCLAHGIQFLRTPIRERLDHPSNVVCHVTHANAYKIHDITFEFSGCQKQSGGTRG